MGIFNFYRQTKKNNFTSKYNGKIEVIESFNKKKIIVGDAEQTGGTITGMWEEAFSAFSYQRPAFSSCLVLGLGGGDVIRSIVKRYPKVDVTCIEIDPVMIEVAKKYFQLPPTLKIINDDAFKWVRKYQGPKYDLVVVDLYIGKFNPQQAQSVSFLSRLKNILAQDGFVIYNRHFFQSQNSDYEDFLKRCRKLFSDVSELVKYKYCRILKLEARR